MTITTLKLTTNKHDSNYELHIRSKRSMARFTRLSLKIFASGAIVQHIYSTTPSIQITPYATTAPRTQSAMLSNMT